MKWHASKLFHRYEYVFTDYNVIYLRPHTEDIYERLTKFVMQLLRLGTNVRETWIVVCDTYEIKWLDYASRETRSIAEGSRHKTLYVDTFMKIKTNSFLYVLCSSNCKNTHLVAESLFLFMHALRKNKIVENWWQKLKVGIIITKI